MSNDSVVIEQLTITQDGTYTAPAGKAYSPVVVNVVPGIYAELLSQTWGT